MGTVSRYNYLVILLPGARAALVDNFACEQRVLGGIHLRVLGLLRESLEGLGSCKKQKQKCGVETLGEKRRMGSVKGEAGNGKWEMLGRSVININYFRCACKYAAVP